MCCGSWGGKESDKTEWLNGTGLEGWSKSQQLFCFVLFLVTLSFEMASPGAGRIKIRLLCRRHRRCGLDPWVRKILWRRA